MCISVRTEPSSDISLSEDFNNTEENVMGIYAVGVVIFETGGRYIAP